MFLSTDTLIYSYISTIFFLRNFFLHVSGLYALSGGPDSYAPSGAGLAYQNPTEQLHLHNAQEKTVRCYQEGVLLVVKGEKRPSEDEWSWKHLTVNQRESKIHRPFTNLFDGKID
jgi:hypothetical protein